MIFLQNHVGNNRIVSAFPTLLNEVNCATPCRLDNMLETSAELEAEDDHFFLDLLAAEQDWQEAKREYFHQLLLSLVEN